MTAAINAAILTLIGLAVAGGITVLVFGSGWLDEGDRRICEAMEQLEAARNVTGRVARP